MFLLVSVRHVGAHPNELQHDGSIQSSINLGTTFSQISRIRIIPSTQILATVFVYLPPFISQILNVICRMVLIFFDFDLFWMAWHWKPIEHIGGNFPSAKSSPGVNLHGWPYQFERKSKTDDLHGLPMCFLWTPKPTTSRLKPFNIHTLPRATLRGGRGERCGSKKRFHY